MVKAAQKAPWKKRNPKQKGEHEKLSPAEKAAAKENAKKAGRPYPKLIDNMMVTAKRKR